MPTGRVEHVYYLYAPQARMQTVCDEKEGRKEEEKERKEEEGRKRERERGGREGEEGEREREAGRRRRLHRLETRRTGPRVGTAAESNAEKPWSH